MSAVREKLNSQAGAAMVIALVFFLLCVMVGVVIVTAASVSAGSVALERQTWRETEALTSAARLLADDVTGMTFIGKYTKTKTVTTTVSQTGTGDSATYETKVESKTENEPYYINTGLNGSNLLSGDLITALYNKKEVTDTSPSDVSVPLSFTAGAGNDGSGGSGTLEDVPDVDGKLTVSNKDYTITAVLTCEDSTLTMVFDAKVSESVGTSTQETTENTSSIAVKKTTTPYTTTITWSKPVITKGGTTS